MDIIRRQPIIWSGTSREDIQAFSDQARQRAGREPARVQEGLQPADFKPMPQGKENAMTEKMKMVRGSGNVFLDLGYSREDAQNLILRSELMSRIERHVRSSGLSQKECAARMGVTQPRLNDLLKAKIDKFSLDALVNMLGRAGMRVELKVKRAA